ncbi:MAG TPA: MFS transporter [Stellaceae bacterium]|jgi:SHS family lactate transporter-like MFS transporter|nr:MFS transporter [Stellaceae bacterium]
MTTAVEVADIPWWREPTRDQWYAWVAAWLGWTLDAFDFTIFLLIMAPIAKTFNVPLVEVTAVFTLTLWGRFVGATASGWLADRVGRKPLLMISIAWYSVCNFIAGLAPAFWVLFVFRALLGIGMGAEWPVGAALSMETWPTRSRGFMGAVLQGSWGIGFLLSSGLYALLYNIIGWRGLLIIGVLPAFAIIYVRIFIKEPPVWVENRQLQRLQQREVRTPLFSIFKLSMLGNTLSACFMMASAFVLYYANYALFATHLQLDLHLSPALVALPIALANALFFVSSLFWGWMAERIGRRWAIIIPGLIGIPVCLIYLLIPDYTWVVVGFALQGMFALGGMHVHYPAYLSERFPTEVRATAAGFCYHQGAIWGGLAAPLLVEYATSHHIPLSGPILVTTVVCLVIFVISVYLGPETKGKDLVPDLVVA